MFRFDRFLSLIVDRPKTAVACAVLAASTANGYVVVRKRSGVFFARSRERGR